MRIILDLDPNWALVAFAESPEDIGEITATLGKMAIVRRDGAGRILPPDGPGYRPSLVSVRFVMPDAPEFELIEKWEEAKQAKQTSQLSRAIQGGLDAALAGPASGWKQVKEDEEPQ